MKVKDEDLRRELEIALSRQDTQDNCAKRLGIKLEKFKNYIARARVHGIDAVLHCNKPHYYTDEFKLSVVHSVIEEKLPWEASMTRFNVDCQTIKNWVNKYLSGGEELLLSDNRGRPSKMGRKPKPKPEDFEPGSVEYLNLKIQMLERENELLKKAMPLIRETIRNRSRGKSGTGSSED